METHVQKHLILAVGLSVILLFVLIGIHTVRSIPPILAAPSRASEPSLAAVSLAASAGITMTVDSVVVWKSTPDRPNETRLPVTVTVYANQTPAVTNTQYYSVVLTYGDAPVTVETTKDMSGQTIVPSDKDVYVLSFAVPLTRTGVHTLSVGLTRVYTDAGAQHAETVRTDSGAPLCDTAGVFVVPAIGLIVVPVTDVDGHIYLAQQVRLTALVTPAISPDDPRDRFWVSNQGQANTIEIRDRSSGLWNAFEQMISGTNQVSWVTAYTSAGSFIASALFKSGTGSVYGSGKPHVLSTASYPVEVLTPSITLSLNSSTTSYMHTTGEIVASARVPAHAAIGVTSTVLFDFGDGTNDTQLRTLRPGQTVVTATKQYVNTSPSAKTYTIRSTLWLSGEHALAVVPSNEITLTVNSLYAYRVVVAPAASRVVLPVQGTGTVSVTTYLEDSSGNRWIPSERGKLSLDTSFGNLDKVGIDDSFSASTFLLSSDVAGTAKLVASFGISGQSHAISNTATVEFVREEPAGTSVIEIRLDPSQASTTQKSLGRFTFSLLHDTYEMPVIVKITQLMPSLVPSNMLAIDGFRMEVFDAATGIPLPETDFRNNGTVKLTYKVSGNDTTPPVLLSTVYTARLRGGVWTVIPLSSSSTRQAVLSQSGQSMQMRVDIPSPGTYGVFGSSHVSLYLPFVEK